MQVELGERRRRGIKGRGSSLAQVILFQEQEKTRYQNSEAQIQHLIQTYKQNKELTTEKLIKEVIPALSVVPYLIRICPSNTTMTTFLTHAVPGFQYEYYSQGRPVFHYGDKGDKFYLILSGRVGVFLPKSEEQMIEDAKTQLKKFPDVEPTYEKIQKTHMKPNNKLLMEDRALLFETGELERYFNENKQCLFHRVHELEMFDYFGELALTLDKCRSATIIPLEDLHLLSLTKKDFRVHLPQYLKRVSERQMLSICDKFDFFQALFPETSKQSITKVVPYFKDIEFQPKQVIWNEDQESDFCMVIRQGQLQVIKQNIAKMQFMLDTQQLLKCSIVGENNFVGDEELINKCKRLYTCQAMQETVKAYYLSVEDFNIIRKQFPEIYSKLIERNNIKKIWLLKRQANIISVNSEQLHQFNQIGKNVVEPLERMCVLDLDEPLDTKYQQDFDENNLLRSQRACKMPTKDYLVDHKIRLHERHLKKTQEVMRNKIPDYDSHETFQRQMLRTLIENKIVREKVKPIEEDILKDRVISKNYQVFTRSIMKQYSNSLRRKQQKYTSVIGSHSPSYGRVSLDANDQKQEPKSIHTDRQLIKSVSYTDRQLIKSLSSYTPSFRLNGDSNTSQHVVGIKNQDIQSKLKLFISQGDPRNTEKGIQKNPPIHQGAKALGKKLYSSYQKDRNFQTNSAQRDGKLIKFCMQQFNYVTLK